MIYIVNKRGLIETLQEFSDTAHVYYPVKSNANKKLLQLIDPYVCGYEVESLYHARLLIKDLKISPDRILFSFQIIPLESTRELLRLQITHFVVDDLKRCNYLINKACKLNVLLKIMLRFDVLEVIKTDLVAKWGASSADIASMKNLLRDYNQNFEGISYYLPQEINNLNNSQKIIDFILEKFGDDLKALNVGGGISPKDLFAIKNDIEANQRNSTTLFVEPGRPMLNPNIDLLVKVTDIRQKNNRKLLFIDSGIYSGLIDCVIKGRLFEIKPVKNDSNLEAYLVCGNSSDVSDVIGTYCLPTNIKIGDKLLIKNCGAYCSEMDMDFCKDKRANYIIVDS